MLSQIDQTTRCRPIELIQFSEALFVPLGVMEAKQALSKKWALRDFQKYLVGIGPALALLREERLFKVSDDAISVYG